MTTRRTEAVVLELEPELNTILLGPEIGSATLDDGRKLRVVASGSTVEFSIDGDHARVRFSLNELAASAVQMLDGGGG